METIHKFIKNYDIQKIIIVFYKSNVGFHVYILKFCQFVTPARSNSEHTFLLNRLDFRVQLV